MKIQCAESFSRILVVITCSLALLLPGCSQSVNKRIPSAATAAGLAGLPEEPNENSILNKSAEELLASGYAYLSMQNPGLARMHFAAALEKDPTLSEAYVGLGTIEQKSGNISGAIRFFTKAAESDPSNITPLIKLSQALRQDSKLDQAEKSILKATEMAPDDLQVLAERAILHDQRGTPELAEPIYHQILERDPKRADIINNLGVNYMLREQYDDAIATFRQALQLNRSNSRIKNNLAAAYALSGDEQNALRVFTGTIGKAQAYNNLGYLYMTAGRLDDAERVLNKAIELNPRFYTRAQENLDRVLWMESGSLPE